MRTDSNLKSRKDAKWATNHKTGKLIHRSMKTDQNKAGNWKHHGFAANGNKGSTCNTVSQTFFKCVPQKTSRSYFSIQTVCLKKIMKHIEVRDHIMRDWYHINNSPSSVIVPDVHCCQGRDTVLLAADRGLISNYMTQLSGCGGVDCPWVLQASPGRRINITLLDFGTYQMVSMFSHWKSQYISLSEP